MSQPDAFADARLLVEAIARLWPQILDLVGADRDRFESAQLIALRALDAAMATARTVDTAAGEGRVGQAQRDVLAVFEAYPAAYRGLAGVFAAVERGAIPLAIPGAVAHERYLQVPVFYATDRAKADNPRPTRWFSGQRGELSYGVAQVSIPDDHRMAALAKPRPVAAAVHPEPGQHVAVLDVEPLEQTEFVRQAADAVAGATVPEALVFIHGYNVSFTDAARRAAQIAYDLHFQGLPMLYSWPSESAALRYTTDENNTVWTKPTFAAFLQLALTGIGAHRVHALAHSMGNRACSPTASPRCPPNRPHAGAGHLRRARHRRRGLHPTRRSVRRPRRGIHPLRLIQRQSPASLPTARALPARRTNRRRTRRRHRRGHDRRLPTRHWSDEPLLLRRPHLRALRPVLPPPHGNTRSQPIRTHRRNTHQRPQLLDLQPTSCLTIDDVRTRRQSADTGRQLPEPSSRPDLR